jgi:aldehyde:ferredoxin oxidoreductase
MNGWMGKILHINLNSGKIVTLDTKPYADKYLGGRGIGLALYWEKVKPEIKAFDPENCLIFMTGPLVATSAQGATLMAVVGKSPATIPEGFCYGNLTGFVGAELKKAGYDGLIVEGRAAKPTYILIQDDKVEIKDASALWGKYNGYDTGKKLQEAHGEKTKYIAIGAAGEHLVRTAVALATHDCTVSAGFGAVMGSKNLKAIAIQGSGTVHVNDLEKLHELNRYTIKISKRVRLSVPPRIENTKYAELLEVIGKGNCYQCGLECVAGMYRYGKKLIGHRKCQSVEYYLPWAFGREDEPIETFYNAPVMANDYGFDSWEMGSIVQWLYDCYKAGALTERETGLPLSTMGTGEFLEKLMHAIAYREGIGDILADGLMRGSARLPAKAKAMINPTVAPIGQNYLFQPREYPIMSLLYPFEPRVHHINYHDVAFVHIAWSYELRQPGCTGVTTKLVHRIAREFWGSDEAGDFSSYEGKALAAKTIQHRTYVKEMIGLCDWGYPISYSLNTPDHMGDPDIEAKLVTAVTGIPGEKLDEYGERVYNLQRLILLREGRQTPAADYPMEFNFTEPLQGMAGMGIMVPGPGKSAVDMVGNKLNKAKFNVMLKEYYRLRGWDEATGVPLAKTLVRLGLTEYTPAKTK